MRLNESGQDPETREFKVTSEGELACSHMLQIGTELSPLNERNKIISMYGLEAS